MSELDEELNESPGGFYKPEPQNVCELEYWDDLADAAFELQRRYDPSMLPWMMLALLSEIKDAIESQIPEKNE